MWNCIEILKQKGVKLTSQRAEVFRILRNAPEHLTVEEVFSRARKKFPIISLATVYCILETLKKNNLIEELQIIPGKACFNVRTDLHHHFYCKKCKKITDIDIPFCATLEKKEVAGNIIEECKGYFYGVCKACRKK
jgi:Fur family peroxide stress response transcriptional regulator